MDLWVVAAAAGAGCLAKYWQDTLKKEGGTSKQVGLSSADERSESVNALDQHVGRRRAESGSYLFQRLVQKQVAEGFSSDADGRHPEASGTGILLEEMDSINRAKGDKLMSSEEYVRNNSSLLSLQPWIFRKESSQQDEEEMTEIRESLDKFHYDVGQYANFQPHPSPRNIGPAFRRSKSSLRGRRFRKYSVKPLSSIENCLIPQLYKDNIDFEEYVLSPFSSPSSPSVRPFMVTDGNQIISKSSFESLTNQSDSGLHQQVDSRVNDVVIGVSPLQASRKPKRKCEEGQEAQHGRRNTNDSQLCTNVSQLPELLERVTFFCLGLNIGVMSSIVTNKREMEKLNDLLKHNENLVQDLQEELEMKNSLVVRELVNKISEDEEHQNNFPDIEGQVHLPLKYDSKFSSPKQQNDKLAPPNFSREDEKKESMSKIEAELEAELERLELNMNASSLEGRMSSLAKLDPDLVGNVIHGELREDILAGKSQDQADSDGDTNESSTAQDMANYCVSPKELSLRLYEVIQSQMEERIKELETALHHRKKQLHFMEAENASSRGGFSSSDVGTSNQESPIMMDRGDDFDHPLCLNLSGDALDAYNEAYEEFLRMNNMEEENPSSTTNISQQNDGDGLCSSDQSVSCTNEAPMTNETLTNSKIFGGKSPWNITAGGQLSKEGYGGDDIKDDDIDDDDEEGRMLIQQIVERTRQGAPILINAQKMLSLWTNG